MGRSRMREVLTAYVCLMAGAVVSAQSAATLNSWDASIAAVEARVAQELASRAPFLALEHMATGAADRKAVLAGQVVMRQVETRDPRGRTIDIPDGLLHHWIGAIFVPNVGLDDLLTRLQNTPPERYQDDVVTSAILTRSAD